MSRPLLRVSSPYFSLSSLANEEPRQIWICSFASICQPQVKRQSGLNQDGRNFGGLCGKPDGIRLWIQGNFYLQDFLVDRG